MLGEVKWLHANDIYLIAYVDPLCHIEMTFNLLLSVRVLLLSVATSGEGKARVNVFSIEPQLHVSKCESRGMHQPLEAII